MKISTFVKRALKLDIEYLKEFNEVTPNNLARLLQENSITAPEVYKQDLPKLIQDVLVNHSKDYIFDNQDGTVKDNILHIVRTIVDKEYSLQVSNYK